VAGLLTLVMVSAILWIQMISAQLSGQGRILSPLIPLRASRSGWGASQVYNLQLQQTIQAEVVGFSLAPGKS